MNDFIWEVGGRIYALVQGAEDMHDAKDRITECIQEPERGYLHECNVPRNVELELIRFRDIATTESVHVKDI